MNQKIPLSRGIQIGMTAAAILLSLFMGPFGVMTGIVLWKPIDWLFAGPLVKWQRQISIQQVFQWLFNPLIGLGTAIALWAVFPGKIFGTGIVNVLFYDLGILLAAGVLFYGVNYQRKTMEPLMSLNLLKKEWQNWAMTVCFAMALWSCFTYMNGLFDIHHRYATCRLLIWFSLALICTFRFDRSQLLKSYNLLYLAAASFGGYLYAKPYRGIEEQDELYRLQAYVMVIGGFALLQMMISLVNAVRNKEIKGKRLFLPYVTATIVMMTLLVVFANGRSWTKLMVIVFGIFYLRMWMWPGRNRLLSIFGYALILNFLQMIVYSLMHRPYLRFRYNRYGMGFHTVTMTGYYLALVLCAVVVILYIRYRKTRRWRDGWKELSLLGMGNVYLFLTLSRTGYLAAFVMESLVILLMGLFQQKRRGRMMLQSLGLFFLSTLFFFPIVFTAQRTIPALINDPIYTEYEVWEYTTDETTQPDSELYIDLEAFIKVAKNKLFGQDMGNISLSSVWERGKPVYLSQEGSLLASIDPEMDQKQDISNGRFAIFRAYITHWNATGHKDMGVELENGEISVHAHNTFLQVAHDHGMITGIGFLLFGLLTFFLGLYRLGKEHRKRPELLLIVAVVIAFGAAGMVEWIYHLCNPFGFSLMVIIAPLLFTGGSKYGKEKI